MAVLVAGGAGYIGSHVNKELNKKGYETLVYDSLVYGHEYAVQHGKFVKGDLADVQTLRKTFADNKIDAVMHFAAFTYVGESVTDPEKYYINNVVNTVNLLKVMREFGCDKFIFSSTCATYGNPVEIPLTESHPQAPVNPYGNTKYMVEQIVKDYYSAYGLKYVIFRYFNAAGADVSGQIGEDHNPETHLIPLVLETAAGRRESISVFGTDYPTDDGTCIRDYIHVTDLATAHILGLEYLMGGGESTAFNLGNGNGYSVKEIIECAERVTGKRIKCVYADRRAGDPAVLIGSSERAKNILGWNPLFAGIDKIIATAWNWHNRKR